MPKVTKNLKGKVYGQLMVIDRASSRASVTYWLCVCTCGVKREVRASSLMNGNTKSCGCSRGKPHGLKSHKLYGTWKMMIHRCYNPKSRSYSRYGGRGIKVCKRWRKGPKHFIEDMGERPEGMTLDRFPDMNGNYKPSNCRWATPEQQANNRRNKE